MRWLFRVSASSIDWLVPNMALKCLPVRPSGRPCDLAALESWLAGYFTCECACIQATPSVKVRVNNRQLKHEHWQGKPGAT
jgi:hypothetical protein